VLGAIVVLYMRQEAVNVPWWLAVLVAAGLTAYFGPELALPANAFASFFARYVIIATLVTAVLARLLPQHLTSEMPVRFFVAGAAGRVAASQARARRSRRRRAGAR
jgi:hypothetical protein